MKDTREGQQFWGYLLVGVVAISAGIVMFLKVVPGRYPVDAAPRDMQLVFTQMYSRQSTLKENTGKFTSSFRELMIEEGDCRKFNCQLKVDSDGQDYQFLLISEGRSWFIQSRSPMPKEIKANGEISAPQKI